MEHFDFDAPADVFAIAGGRQWRCPMTYRRFRTGAEAIRHVIEGLGADAQCGAVVESDEARLGPAEIRAMYESTDFPLRRLRRTAHGSARAT
jgi:hypothetical protein